jgi:thiamine pyrophosphate-dependent acetolactate synthase large subunit-like protein
MSGEQKRMSMRDALLAVQAVRRDDDLVVTTMGAAREWMAMGSHPLDLVLVPSSMGQATSFGLGLALAQPLRRVIVVNGDGSMLMNLGSLVTITSMAPANLTLILADNGVYEVTGAQVTPGSAEGREDATSVDFAAMAHASGFRSVFRFSESEQWSREIGRIFDAPGPRFIALDVLSVPGTPGPRSPGPAGPRARALMAALRGADGER